MEKEILKQRIKEFIYENTSFDEINADDNMDTASDKIADYIINKVLPQANVSGSLPIAVSSVLDKRLPADGKIGGAREILRMQIHQDMLKILSGNDR